MIHAFENGQFCSDSLKYIKASKTNRGAGLKMLWMLVIIGNITIDSFVLRNREKSSETRPWPSISPR